MAQLLDHVERGQIISADRWNLLIDAVNELIAAGQAGGIRLDATIPEGTLQEPLREGVRLQIVGRGFGYSIGQTLVTFETINGNVLVRHDALLPGSSDERLLLIVPPLPALAPAGETALLRVNNGLTYDTRSVIVRPRAGGVEGDIFVNWRTDVANPTPNPLTAGQHADFAFTLRASTTASATFDLTPAFSNATVPVPSELIQSILVLDANTGATIPRRLTLGMRETRNVIVRIPQIPANWTNQSFRFDLGAASGDVTGTDGRPITVGSPVDPLDPNITMSHTGTSVFDSASGASDPDGGRLQGKRILVRGGKTLILQFDGLFRQVAAGQADRYDVTIEERGGGPIVGWQLGLFGTSPVINVTTAIHRAPIEYSIAAQVGAQPAGGIVLRVKRQGATLDWNSDYDLELLQ